MRVAPICPTVPDVGCGLVVRVLLYSFPQACSMTVPPRRAFPLSARRGGFLFVCSLLLGGLSARRDRNVARSCSCPRADLDRQPFNVDPGRLIAPLTDNSRAWLWAFHARRRVLDMARRRHLPFRGPSS